jgi:hypothetical protein
MVPRQRLGDQLIVVRAAEIRSLLDGRTNAHHGCLHVDASDDLPVGTRPDRKSSPLWREIRRADGAAGLTGI